MTRSSKSRRKRARAKKWTSKHANTSVGTAKEQSIRKLNKADKRFIVAFAVLSFFITCGYWWLAAAS